MIPEDENLSYDQSLEYLSLSIQNRLKVEADQNTDCPNNNVLLERLSKLNALVDEFSQKIEERLRILLFEGVLCLRQNGVT